MMNKEALRTFLAKPIDAIIAVNRAGKGAQLTPVWFLWDGEAFYFTTGKASAKYLNMQRDPNISLIINDQATHTFVTAHGPAKILEGDEINPGIIGSMLEKYIPDEEQRKQFAAMMAARPNYERIAVVLHPEKIFSMQAPG
jgi:PPOX class probable F420-dependent enzyme